MNRKQRKTLNTMNIMTVEGHKTKVEYDPEIDDRFRGQLCYIDAYTEPYVPKMFDPKLYGEYREEHIERLRNTPTYLCRIQCFGDEDRWSLACYTYSHETYEPCVFSENWITMTKNLGRRHCRYSLNTFASRALVRRGLKT